MSLTVTTSGYSVRILEPHEWDKLQGTEAEPVVPYLDPDATRVLVVEHEGKLVGTWMLVRMFHAECLWVHPDHRKSPSIGRKLLYGMYTLAQSMGLRAVITHADAPEIHQLCRKVGATPIPGQAYAVPVQPPPEDNPCPPPSPSH